jgi:hypothetical protein
MFKDNYYGENEVIKPLLKKTGLGHRKYTKIIMYIFKIKGIIIYNVIMLLVDGWGGDRRYMEI